MKHSEHQKLSKPNGEFQFWAWFYFMSLQMAEKVTDNKIGTDTRVRPGEKEREGFGSAVAAVLQCFVGIHVHPLLLNHFCWQQVSTKDQS